MSRALKLQERDIHLLEEIQKHGSHSIRAIAEFYFDGKIHAARKRILKLTKEGFITKHQNNAATARYFVVSDNRQPNRRHLKSEHDFEVKETVASLLTLFRCTDKQFNAAYSFTSRLTQWFKSTDPDAHIHLNWQKGREEHFFIEQDRGTEPLQTIVGKCRRYQHLRQAEGSKSFRVLFVCKSGRRAENICKILQNETSIKKLVWCAAFKDVVAYPSKPIWITPSQTVDKMELFPTSKPNH